MKRACWLLTSIICLIFLLVGCSLGSKKPAPEDTVKKFEKALNDSDIDGMLDCFEPDVKKLYEGIMALTDAVTGVEMSKILNGIMAGGELMLPDEEMPDYSIEINDKTELADDKVQLNITINMHCKENDSSQNNTVILVYLDDAWYFSAEPPVYSSNSEDMETSTSQTGNLQIIDPFADIEIIYTGASPLIQAEVDTSLCQDEVKSLVTFDLEDELYSNGDTIKVTACFNEAKAKQNGISFSPAQLKLTVENQPEYLTGTNEIDLTGLKAEIEDKLESVTCEGTGEAKRDFAGTDLVSTFQSVQYKELTSGYFLSLKPQAQEKAVNQSLPFNQYCFIYKFLVNSTSFSYYEYKEQYQKLVVVIVYANNLILDPSDKTLHWDNELAFDSDTDYDSIVNKYTKMNREYYKVDSMTNDMKSSVSKNNESELKKTVFEGNNHSYVICNESMSWEKANDSCKKMGGYLATITTAEEQAFVEQLAVLNGNRNNYWLGGTYSSGTWNWITNEIFNFSNWDLNQPDGYSSNENYLRFFRETIHFNQWTAMQGKWNDASNVPPLSDDDCILSTYGYVCEFE